MTIKGSNGGNSEVYEEGGVDDEDDDDVAWFEWEEGGRGEGGGMMEGLMLCISFIGLAGASWWVILCMNKLLLYEYLKPQ